MSDASIMNLCVVSEGTYEVCSRTTVAKNFSENAKWLLNVKWQMEGVDIHLDVNIGKQLSALGHTLTSLSSFEEEECTTIYSQDSDDGDHNDKTNKVKRNALNLPFETFVLKIFSNENRLNKQNVNKKQWKMFQHSYLIQH